MDSTIKKGIYPTMVTPFDDSSRIDYKSLEVFIEKLENDGADGLFAVCQSSEMFNLEQKEKTELARFVKRKSTLDVVASGHTQKSVDEQIEAMKEMEQTGVDAVVLISNAFAGPDEDDDVFLRNLDLFLNGFRTEIQLGMYECPFPYKRLLSSKVLGYIKETGRFTFMKDTSCDAGIIGERLLQTKGSRFGLYNANAHTLAFSTMNGAAGYSGVHANISVKLVAFIMNNPVPMDIFQAEAHRLFYDFAYFMSNSKYPVSAKIMLQRDNIFRTVESRVINPSTVGPDIYLDSIRMYERIKEFENQL